MNEGIPTTYRGAAMRSGLEAKWAAFFDLLGWRWLYEPIEFSGWIPDFVLLGAKQQTYVEVKPVFEFPRTIADQIDASGCDAEVLIVGMGPALLPDRNNSDARPMGWLRESWEDGGRKRWGWDCAYFHGGDCYARKANREYRPGLPSGFHHATGGWNDRMSGFYDGDHGSFYDNELLITKTWHEASSLVQWKHKGLRSA